jgi:hypothetical protein
MTTITVWVTALVPVNTHDIRVRVSANKNEAYWDLAEWLDEARFDPEDFESNVELEESLSDQSEGEITNALNNAPQIAFWTIQKQELEVEV